METVFYMIKFEYPIKIIRKDNKLTAFAESPLENECVYLKLSSSLNVKEGERFNAFIIDTELREIVNLF